MIEPRSPTIHQSHPCCRDAKPWPLMKMIRSVACFKGHSVDIALAANRA